MTFFKKLLEKFLLWLGGFALGKNYEEKKNLEKANKIKDEQLKIASSPNASRDDMLDLMHKDKM